MTVSGNTLPQILGERISIYYFSCFRRITMSEWVEDGYPTEEALERIRTWQIHKNTDFAAALDFAMSIWHWPDYATKDGNEWRFATGGWSGNESIIEALEQNTMLYMMTWKSSERGGKHIFEPMRFRENNVR